MKKKLKVIKIKIKIKRITLCCRDTSEMCDVEVKKERKCMIPSQESLMPSRIACWAAATAWRRSGTHFAVERGVIELQKALSTNAAAALRAAFAGFVPQLQPSVTAMATRSLEHTAQHRSQIGSPWRRPSCEKTDNKRGDRES